MQQHWNMWNLFLGQTKLGSHILSQSRDDWTQCQKSSTFSREFSLIGLALIALGTGGIKPCVASFGGDQFKLPEQEAQLKVCCKNLQRPLWLFSTEHNRSSIALNSNWCSYFCSYVYFSRRCWQMVQIVQIKSGVGTWKRQILSWFSLRFGTLLIFPSVWLMKVPSP